MNLFFDGRFINPSNPDGISSFSIGLIRELAKKTELQVLVSSKDQMDLLGDLNFKMCSPATSIWEPLLAFKLRKEKIVVLFSPMQTTGSLGKKFKLILTLHDLIYYRHKKPPAAFNPFLRVGWFLFHLTYWPQRLLLNRADAVVSVSETTKKQMLEHALTKKPIHVIHNASNEPVSRSVKSRHENNDLVYMGSFIGYKNMQFLIEAMGLLPENRLVLLSRISPGLRKKFEDLAYKSGARLHFANGVTDAEYSHWLNNCKALVSASLDEGFGIPLVEAMCHGTPVIVSDIEIFQEVAGSAGLFFNPRSKKDFASKVQELSQEQSWSSHSRLAISQAKNFSWESSAKKLLELAKGLGSPGI